MEYEIFESVDSIETFDELPENPDFEHMEPLIPRTLLHMDKIIAVGFGAANLTKDGWQVYYEDKTRPLMSVAQAEELASKDPHHDWQIALVAPLWEAYFQRQGEGQWVMYKKGAGFA